MARNLVMIFPSICDLKCTLNIILQFINRNKAEPNTLFSEYDNVS